MKSVARRIVDRHVLHLIKMWLEVPVEETDERGGKKRMTRHRDEKLGIPQRSPLSPLLANLYMRRFVLGWQRKGFEARFKAHVSPPTLTIWLSAAKARRRKLLRQCG